MPKQLKELDSLLFTAAGVLGIVGLFVDETIRRLAPLVAVVGLTILAVHLVRRHRQRRAVTSVQMPGKLRG